MHSTSAWLPIFWLAVPNVTLLAATECLWTMSALPLMIRSSSAVCRKRNARPFSFVGSVNVRPAVAMNSSPLSSAVTV